MPNTVKTSLGLLKKDLEQLPVEISIPNEDAAEILVNFSTPIQQDIGLVPIDPLARYKYGAIYSGLEKAGYVPHNITVYPMHRGAIPIIETKSILFLRKEVHEELERKRRDEIAEAERIKAAQEEELRPIREELKKWNLEAKIYRNDITINKSEIIAFKIPFRNSRATFEMEKASKEYFGGVEDMMKRHGYVLKKADNQTRSQNLSRGTLTKDCKGISILLAGTPLPVRVAFTSGLIFTKKSPDEKVSRTAK